MAGVVGVFLTLGALGFGLVMFGRPNLEVVSDTVSHSFGRAFATGLLGQLLLLPTFGMLVVGLILSVVGIVLLPFAVVVYALLVIVGAVGGYLAVAHAMGETYTRRRHRPRRHHRLAQQLSLPARRTGCAGGVLGGVVGLRLGAGGRRPDPRRGHPRDLAARHRRLRRGAPEPRGDPRELRRAGCCRPRRSPTNTSGPPRSSA